MKHRIQHVICGLAVAGSALAAGPALMLTSPADYEVFQRQSLTQGAILVEGAADTAAAVEVRLDGAGWRSVPVDPRTKRFRTSLPATPGGWRQVEVRATTAGQAALVVEHVGVGEVFIVAGQSNAANHGAEKQQSETAMVAAFDGTKWQPCRDPQPGASGGGGSFMPAFGDALAARYKVPIGIAACAIGATSVRQWLPNGATMTNQPTTGACVTEVRPGVWASNGQAFDSLLKRVAHFGTNGVRAILWHQGESDAGQARAGYPADRQISGDQYRRFMEQLIRATRERAGWKIPWCVAQATYHSEQDPADAEFRAAQRGLWTAGLALEGPDTDALREPFRAGVHFNGTGQKEHGRRWAEKVGAYLDEVLKKRP